jgi:hypothetical protein
MNSQRPPDWQEPLETWLLQSRNHTLSDEDRSALNTLLRTSPEARAHAARFLAEDALLSERLRQSRMEALFEEEASALAAVQAPPPVSALSAKPAFRFPWRTLTTLAAGLALGLFSASVVFGYVGVGSIYGKVLTLLNESFEGGDAPEPKGAPLHPGIWSGDFSEITGSFAGVTPAQGVKMLRFLRAGHLDKASHTGCKGDVYRILDVREYAASFAGGKAMVTAEARFASIPTKAPASYDACIELQALEVLPANASQFFFPTARQSTRLSEEDADAPEEAHPYFKPATSQRQIPLPPSGNTWQRVRAELRIPAGTRYLVVGLHLLDRVAANQKPELRDVSFPGQFADDIQVRLIRSVPLP